MFFCTSLLFASCNSNDSSQLKIDNLESEIGLLKDSIQVLNSTPSSEYLVDTLRVDTSDGFLGSLYSDTLLLTAEFAECGEWGGNRESIIIYKEERKTMCIILRDSANCEYFDPKTKYIRVDSSVHLLNRIDEQAIIQYLHDLTELSFLNQEPIANALHSYSAEIIPSEPEGLQLSYFETHTLDWSFMWPNYVELSAKLKN